ncbi:MAG: hypothetical protein R2700_16390 [Solirubrobacterales bacterium]
MIAAWVYISLVVVATPSWPTRPATSATTTCSTRSSVPCRLALPLVVGAVLSQFSAAVADTVAAHGNFRVLQPGVGNHVPYLITAVAVTALSWSIDLFTLVVVASRAFAAYYCAQAVVAMLTSTRPLRRAGFGALAAVLLAITLFAVPVG